MKTPTSGYKEESEVMKVTDSLPPGWKISPLDQICTITMGQSPPSKFYNADGKGLPFFQGKADFSNLYPEASKWCTQPSKVAHEEDVLISVRAPVGPTNLAPSECCIGRGLASIRPNDDLPNRYILYYLRSIEADIAAHGTGTTFKAISGKILRSLPVPVAPSNEQKSIVAEIEKQFSRLDEAVANLKRVKANLKRYKAAVLKAAVEGKLTEEWRKEHPDVEPASELLKRILAERRRKWEQSELDKMHARGKEPKDDKWKEKYKEPRIPDSGILKSLPNGWTWVKLENIFNAITDGDHQAPPKTDAGVPFLVIGNVNDGKLNFNQTRFVSSKYFESLDETRVPRYGDLLFTVVGSYGIPVKVDTEKPFCVQRHIAILKPSSLVSVDYLYYILHSKGVYLQATEVATGTAQKTVPLGGLRSITIPLPPLAEQKQLASEIDQLFTRITQALETTSSNEIRAERLRQSILNRAFSGMLLPPHGVSYIMTEKDLNRP